MNQPIDENDKSNGYLAIASLIAGIISFPSCCCICIVPLPIAGLVMGYFGLKSSKATFAKIGMTLCAIWLLIFVSLYVLEASGALPTAKWTKQLQQRILQLQQQQQQQLQQMQQQQAQQQAQTQPEIEVGPADPPAEPPSQAPQPQTPRKPAAPAPATTAPVAP